ncbi:MAG: CoA transferase [Deltaproteobacteria bacterium]|nr:CoA transferase [Deltaproteobacteria bacterium]
MPLIDSGLPFRVLEVAGPATAPCGRLLAETGADVIKMESPATGRGPSDTSSSALFHDTGKRGITLNLHAPQGKVLFEKLAAQVDVIIESLPPGELSHLGLSFARLSAINPGLVLVSITPFGQDGPYSLFKGNDFVVFAMGGIMFISGEPGSPPVVAPVQQSYSLAATHAALGALSVLWDRSQTGWGDWVDVSMFECLAAQENTITNYVGTGNFARRNGSQHRTALPSRILPCRDGFVHVFVTREEVAWKRFLEWIGNPRDLVDMDLAEINKRWRYEALVNSVTAEFFRQHTRAELFESAQRVHLPCVPVNTPADFLNDPQTLCYDLVMDVQRPGSGPYRTLRPPVDLVEKKHVLPAPRVGEHNHEVYRGLVGLGAEDFIRYAEAKII